MATILYDYPISGNAWKIRTVLRALKRPFVIRWVDLLAEEQNKAAFVTLNPAKQVPVLVLDSGEVLRESSAILLTLATASAWLPEAHRHAITEWLCFEQSFIDGIVSRARFRRLYPEAIPTPETFFDAWLEEGHRGLAILDQHLDTRTYVVGDLPTIADIALYAYTHCADEGGYTLANYSALGAWLTRMKQLPYIRPLDDNPEAEH